MKFLIGFLNIDYITNKNKELAEKENCFGDITKYVFDIIKKYQADEWGFIVPSDYEDRLTQEERNELKSMQYMIDNGWLNNGVVPDITDE